MMGSDGWTQVETRRNTPDVCGWYECVVGPNVGAPMLSDIVVLWWNGDYWTYRAQRSNWHADVKAWRGPLVLNSGKERR